MDCRLDKLQDPNNTNYNTVCSSNAIATYEADKLYLQVSPNPAKDAAVIGYALANNTDLRDHPRRHTRQ
jgi:hypothetical protein